MKRLLTLLAAVAMLLTAGSAMAKIQGTPHDFFGVGAYGRCQVCHVPHAAAGANRLWRKANSGSIPATVWSGTNVGTLCAGCHDGGQLVTGSNADGTAIRTVQEIFADTSHQGVVAKLATDFNGSMPSGRPYTSNTQMECTSCHNVHYFGTYSAASALRPFLRPAAAPAAHGSMTDFCKDCHADRYAGTFSRGTHTTNHPVMMPYSTNINISNRKMVALGSSVAATTVALHDWSLGGKLEGNPTALNGAANVGCQSCHSIHMPAAAVDSAGGTISGARQLLAGSYATSAVCTGCHGASTNSKGSVGKYSGDHPYGAQAPYSYMNLAGAYWTGTDKNAAGGAVCTSCHKAHGGGLTNIRRTFAGDPAETWCASCHGSVAPTGHHSNVNNFAQSAIDCKSCHSAIGASWQAHNGFVYAITGNGNSELCMGCHTGSNSIAITGTVDPVQHLAAYGNDGVTGLPFTAIPLQNLSVTGAGATSHYLGPWGTEAKGGTSKSTRPKTTAWTSDSAAVSKYGSDGQTMVCESCHSILHNIGTGTGSTTTSGYMANLLLQAYTDDDKAAGTNGSGFCVSCHNQSLTLAAGVVASDAALQNKAVAPFGMHVMTNWTTTRARDAGYTGTDLLLKTDNTTRPTYANANVGGSVLPYPGTNMTDCDSCHKPHLADPMAHYDPQQSSLGSVSVILEKAGPSDGDYTTLCQKCHAEGM